MHNRICESFEELVSYCKGEEFKGYDPYDGLNSRIFQSIPFVSKNRIIQLVWIQFFKRSPINFRPIFGIKKDYNPKALGLFLTGYCNLYKINPKSEYFEMINFFSCKILERINKDYSGACWGYNFDWQARAFFQPKNSPTVVATTFIGSALLDAYEITGEKQLMLVARSACDFILKDLKRTYDNEGNFAFSYSPLDQSVVFNASLLGSRLLARVFYFTNEKLLIDAARRSVTFCCNCQRKDGSWSYGTLNYHKWVDSFHTAFNLECIADYIKYSGDSTFNRHLTKGFEYYIQTFFTEKGIPKYYNNSIYPIDIHAPAQLPITLIKLGKFNEQKHLIDKVLNWTINNMQCHKGYFYYQINKFYSSKIPYMRWAQAWMFYAMTIYLLEITDKHFYEVNEV